MLTAEETVNKIIKLKDRISELKARRIKKHRMLARTPTSVSLQQEIKDIVEEIIILDNKVEELRSEYWRNLC